MVTINVNSQKISIKASFNEVTAFDLMAIQDTSPRGILQALSDDKQDIFYDLSPDEIGALYPIISFIDNPEEAAAYLPLDFKMPEIDIASESFDKIELARKIVIKHKKAFKLLPELARFYFGNEDRPASVAMALGAVVLEQMQSFFDRFKDLQADQPSEEEMEAGIEALHSFGPYGIAEGIAAKYGCRPLDVFSWSAEEVYMNLLYSQAKNRYQENLRNIENRKQAVKK